METFPVSTARTAARLHRYLALDDFEAAARRVLPRQIYGYYQGSAETGQSLRANRSSFGAVHLLPRVLADVSGRSARTTLFGRDYAAPFGIAPMGLSGLATFDGDAVLARAAHRCEIPSIVSATSIAPLERIARDGKARWFQAYLAGDDDRITAMVDRVAAAGFDTFVVTADVPVPANRENDLRNGFRIPLKPSVRLALQGLMRPRWTVGTWGRTFLRLGVPHFENMDAFRGPPILSAHVLRNIGKRDQLAWRHIALIRARWKGSMVIKGILSPADARLAREHGVDGVIVSNHGGRQLDGACAPLAALPAIVGERGGMTVMLDGGVRRGTDVLKALALGADFVFVGRPFLYAAAAAGEAGVVRAIDLLQEEILRDMALLGLSRLSELGRQHIAPMPR